MPWKRSATRNLVILVGILVAGLTIYQDIGAVVHGYESVTRWTGRQVTGAVARGCCDALLVVGLGLVLFRNQAGWNVLALAALFTVVGRCVWFIDSGSMFDSMRSPAFQSAYAAADLLFALFCLTVLVDLVRDGRAKSEDAVASRRESTPIDA